MSGNSQLPKEEDEVNFQSATNWLDNKLNYIYYDEIAKKWWKNTLYINDKREVTIKHISGDKLNTAHIKDKDYIIRKFKIEDINPKNLKISDIKKSQSRIVKGKILEIRAFELKKSIYKTINNRKGSSTFFLYLSFPHYLNDSLNNYAEVVKEKLEIAINASTKVYSTNLNEDRKILLKTVIGDFKGENGELWQTKQLQTHILKLNRDNGKEEYFGYDPKRHIFYIIPLDSNGLEITIFELSKNDKIVLKSDHYNLTLETLHIFTLGSVKYFRQ